MQKSGSDPTMSPYIATDLDMVALLICPECHMGFLLRCGPEGLTAEHIAMLEASSSVSQHISRTGHTSVLEQAPMLLETPAVGNGSASQRISLMQAILVALGYECKTDEELELLPWVVRKGLEYYVRQIGSPVAALFPESGK